MDGSKFSLIENAIRSNRTRRPRAAAPVGASTRRRSSLLKTIQTEELATSPARPFPLSNMSIEAFSKLSEEVHAAFQRLDLDDKGELGEERLLAAFEEYGSSHVCALRLGAEEVRELTERYDVNRSGALDRFEFEHMGVPNAPEHLLPQGSFPAFSQ
ncbi:hypothetical protein T484DRAFT_1803845 [Baffinella frigidus]|nr:hypothetical protein T484DRAFT_1803845 [Cryptophyta sp. CCMP2293]